MFFFSFQTSRYSKLEKADILEMTVKHLRSIQRSQMAGKNRFSFLHINETEEIGFLKLQQSCTINLEVAFNLYSLLNIFKHDDFDLFYLRFLFLPLQLPSQLTLQLSTVTEPGSMNVRLKSHDTSALSKALTTKPECIF